MSITNEGSSRLRSWFQFTSKSSNSTSNNNSSNTSNPTSNTSSSTTSNTRSDDENSRTDTECQQQSSNTLLDRVTSFRRSLGKAQNRKHKIRSDFVLFSIYLFVIYLSSLSLKLLFLY